MAFVRSEIGLARCKSAQMSGNKGSHTQQQKRLPCLILLVLGHQEDGIEIGTILHDEAFWRLANKSHL